MKKTLIFFLIIASSCSTTSNMVEKKIIGTYQQDDNLYGISSKIILKDNYTFDHKWVTGLISGTTRGNWKIQGKFIVLESEIQPHSEELKPSKVIRSQFKNIDSLVVRVLDEYSENLPYANCWIEKSKEVVAGIYSDEKGLAKLPKIDSDSLFVSFVGYSSFSLSLKDFKDDYIVVKLDYPNPDFQYYRVFTEKKIKYRRNKLIDDSEKYSKVD